ncbi:Rieske 2Fe-2S domain-containing protein [Pseudonocardia nematodicida]|uniref:Rieske 2Fe-2S domain-containing protein n=1 Tax=Pseudonocardia nematodicida TaxID=1206997 RepID=A0ABV1K529_9PSEU
MRIVVGRVADFPPGERRIVNQGRRSIGVFRVGDSFYALNNHCPHLGGPLCQGRTQAWVRSDRPGHYERDTEHALVACPWHGWEYDLATGRSFLGPGEPPARAYAVSVEAAECEAGAAGGAAAAPEGEPDLAPGTAPAGASGPGGRRPGPYVAETYRVTVERFGPDDHIVVDTTQRPGATPGETGGTGR